MRRSDLSDQSRVSNTDPLSSSQSTNNPLFTYHRREHPPFGDLMAESGLVGVDFLLSSDVVGRKTMVSSQSLPSLHHRKNPQPAISAEARDSRRALSRTESLLRKSRESRSRLPRGSPMPSIEVLLTNPESLEDPTIDAWSHENNREVCSACFATFAACIVNVIR
eukprot:254613_1